MLIFFNINFHYSDFTHYITFTEITLLSMATGGGPLLEID